MSDRVMTDVASAAQTNAPSGSVDPGGTGALVYFGRFAVRLPAAVSAEVEGGSIRDLGVREVAWPAGHGSGRPFAPGGPAEAAWSARLRELRADPSKRPEGKPDVIILERQLAPNLRLLFRHDGRYNERLLAAEALLDAGDHGVWLDAPYQPGAEAKGMDLVRQVAASYRGYPPAGRRPEGIEPAFHLALGAFELPPDPYEGVTLRIRAEAAGFEPGFRIRTDTNRDPEWGSGLVAKFRDAVREPDGYPAAGLHAELPRAGARTVAGLPGEEVLLRLTETAGRDKGAGGFRLEWEYPGDPATGRSQVTVSAVVPGARGTAEARTVATWDDILRGIRPVPQGMGQGGGR